MDSPRFHSDPGSGLFQKIAGVKLICCIVSGITMINSFKSSIWGQEGFIFVPYGLEVNMWNPGAII